MPGSIDVDLGLVSNILEATHRVVENDLVACFQFVYDVYDRALVGLQSDPAKQCEVFYDTDTLAFWGLRGANYAKVGVVEQSRLCVLGTSEQRSH